MADDDLIDEMPEFGKPEEKLPLVVPDLTPTPPELKDKRKRPNTCKGTKKNGKPCGWRITEDYQYCFVHNPDITPEQRRQWKSMGGRAKSGIRHYKGVSKSPKELLAILSNQLDSFLEKYGDATSVDSIRCICELVKAHLAVHDRITDGGADKKLGWSMASKKKA